MGKSKSSNKGSRKLEDQIANLESKVGEDGVKQAEALIQDVDRDVIALAFKRLPKSNKGGLGKRDQATYEQLVSSVGQDAADKWKSDLLASKG